MNFRSATRNDVPVIVDLLANDHLGRKRETYGEPLPDVYYDAFEAIHKDPNQELMVVENEQAEVIGTFQLSYIQYLSYRGGVRAQVESIHVREDQRGKGVGEGMLQWIIGRAQERKAKMLQLTSDKQRPDAIRFYQKQGFIASHEGFKLHF